MKIIAAVSRRAAPCIDLGVAIDACGAAAGLADRAFYQGFDAIPLRGPKAALTVAGTVGGWAKALEVGQGLAALAPTG